MKIKVLHVVGGSLTNGAAKGANVLHEALLNLKIDSKLLNDSTPKVKIIDKKIIFINDTFFKKIINIAFVCLEKILKSIFLHTPRETFTLGFFGFDITKLKEYKNADIIHIHWLNQGFIKFGSLSKINKPLVWTMRDMWPFTGGSHYSMDFEKYEKSYISKKIKNFKKKNYKKNFHFVAVSDWLRNKAQKSSVLKEYDIKRIYNNINTNDFDKITKKQAKSFLNISTKKKIILYGAQNPQSKRKGWNIFIKTLKKLDNTKYFLLIFGNFWSQESLNKIGIEYRSLGFINDKKILNNIYSSADLFVAPSIQDAWPKTFAEAMYCGTPVVCFDNTSISEIVDHKVNVYIVKNFDADLLKKGIDWLSKEIMKNSFNKNNSRIKISNFSGDVIAKKYIKFYKKILI